MWFLKHFLQYSFFRQVAASLVSHGFHNFPLRVYVTKVNPSGPEEVHSHVFTFQLYSFTLSMSKERHEPAPLTWCKSLDNQSFFSAMLWQVKQWPQICQEHGWRCRYQVKVSLFISSSSDWFGGNNRASYMDFLAFFEAAAPSLSLKLYVMNTFKMAEWLNVERADIFTIFCRFLSKYPRRESAVCMRPFSSRGFNGMR